MKKLYGVGDLVVFNKTGKFGNNNDYLFHIHSVRHGICTNISKEQPLYAGYLLEIGEYESEGLPQIPIFRTTIIDVSENHLKALENLRIKFNPYR